MTNHIRIWRRTHSIIDQSRFRKQVNYNNWLISQAKLEYYITLVSSKDDSNGVWQTLNTILHKKKVSTLPDVPADILSDHDNNEL